MRYWWVNHKKTARQELSGGYLWSPKREARGAHSQFYENMKIAERGDFVLSFSDAWIRHVGVILDYARTSLKPAAFRRVGENWDSDGWLLPVAWEALTTPVRPKDRIADLGPLLPVKYSPIHPFTGNGNQKAYLAEIDKRVLELLVDPSTITIGRNMDGSIADAPIMRLDDAVEERLVARHDLDTTTKRQLVLARYGQGIFRARVAELEKSCRLTGIDNPRLLVASHIKPWRVCTTATERLDGANGLLLAPHVDRLFDRGFISFEASGRVIVSPRLASLDLNRLGLNDACARNCGVFTERQNIYLSFHRNNVLLV
ncbi:HNH endonuclease [Granulibacter bethesdensis]|uniref:HNH endonuclease n=1 Tax=Granulibacter bethesdensis TaxID=364410 RepID=UPI0003F1EECB|nr:HNH endonuclease signature motif containing protein [Granulibacter bethesdensis]AHJ66344.1 Type II restriction-modification system restriction subunit [Granulibacter bethesdensis CGDNIH4]